MPAPETKWQKRKIFLFVFYRNHLFFFCSVGIGFEHCLYFFSSFCYCEEKTKKKSKLIKPYSNIKFHSRNNARKKITEVSKEKYYNKWTSISEYLLSYVQIDAVFNDCMLFLVSSEIYFKWHFDPDSVTVTILIHAECGKLDLTVVTFSLRPLQAYNSTCRFTYSMHSE